MIVFFGSVATVTNLVFIRFAVCVCVCVAFVALHVVYIDEYDPCTVVHTQYGTRYKQEQCIDNSTPKKEPYSERERERE